MADNLINGVKRGDKAAFEALLSEYEPLIRSEAAGAIIKAPDLADEVEELRQEGRLALYKAAMTYKENPDVVFGLYAKICIHNRLISYVRSALAKKRREEKARRLALSEGKSRLSEEAMLDLESSANLKSLLEKLTTRYERTVFLMYLQKKSYAEIAQTLGKTPKSVDNAIYRVKTKLKKFFR